MIFLSIFIVGVCCASAVNLDLENGTNAHVNNVLKNGKDISVSMADFLGSSANTKQDPGSGRGCVLPDKGDVLGSAL